MKAHVEAATAPKTADPPASPALGRFDLDKDGFPVHPIMGGSGTHTFRGAGHARTWAVGLDMPEFAKLLSNQLSLPVTDATGLAGKYDFVLSWVPESAGGAPRLPQVDGVPDNLALPTLFAAVRSRL